MKKLILSVLYTIFGMAVVSPAWSQEHCLSDQPSFEMALTYLESHFDEAEIVTLSNNGIFNNDEKSSAIAAANALSEIMDCRATKRKPLRKKTSKSRFYRLIIFGTMHAHTLQTMLELARHLIDRPLLRAVVQLEVTPRIFGDNAESHISGQARSKRFVEERPGMSFCEGFWPRAYCLPEGNNDAMRLKLAVDGLLQLRRISEDLTDFATQGSQHEAYESSITGDVSDQTVSNETLLWSTEFTVEGYETEEFNLINVIQALQTIAQTEVIEDKSIGLTIEPNRMWPPALLSK